MTTMNHAVRTSITRLFQCRYPIVLPGMSWISTPELVAAVSNAGKSLLDLMLGRLLGRTDSYSVSFFLLRKADWAFWLRDP